MPDFISYDVWALLGQWIIFGGSMCAAILGIIQLVKYILSKTTVSKLSEEVQKHSRYLDNDYNKIKELDMRLAISESDRMDMHEIQRLELAAIQELLKNGLSHGENQDGMQRVSDEIQDYLRKQV